MYAFLFLAFPSALVWYCTSHKEYTVRNFVPPVLFGFIAGCIICTAKEFFILSDDPITESFFLTFLSFFWEDAFLAPIVLPLIFILLSKDEPSYKGDALFPLLAAYYALYIPFASFTSSEKNSTFMLFAKPLLYLSMSMIFSLLVAQALTFIKEKQFGAAALAFALTLLSCAVPPLVQTLWYYGTPEAIWIILSVLYIGAGTFLEFFSMKFHGRPQSVTEETGSLSHTDQP